MKQIRWILLSLLCVTGCASNPIQLTHQIPDNKLELCVTFDNHISDDDRLLFLNASSKFINKYNQQEKSFLLASCTNKSRPALNVIIQNTRFIDPQKQALYVVISTLGVAYPLTGGSIGFMWFGLNTTDLQFMVSSESGEKTALYHRQFSSSPYFHSLESLKLRHMEQYALFLLEILQEIKEAKSNIS